MTTFNLPVFELVQNTLKGYSAAECHGFLSAFICVDAERANARFMEEIQSFTEQDPDENILLELSKITQAQFESPDFSFQLLLPDEGASLDARSAALSEWCQGFIYGIGLTRPKMNDDVAEFIADLTEFTRVEFEEEADEEDEIALEELIEFIRMGAMLTHQSLANHNSGPTVH